MKSYKNLRLRLLCKYAIGPIMENGEPEFGYRDMSGRMEVDLPSGIMQEASVAIEVLEAQRDELLDVLKVVRGDLTSKMKPEITLGLIDAAIAKVQS